MAELNVRDMASLANAVAGMAAVLQELVMAQRKTPATREMLATLLNVRRGALITCRNALLAMEPSVPVDQLVPHAAARAGVEEQIADLEKLLT